VNDFEAAVNGRHPHPASRKRAMKLSTLVTLMLCSVIVSVLLVVYALYFVQIANVTREGVKDTAMAVARTLADEPEIKRALSMPTGNETVQDLAQAVQRRNDLLFVVVTDMNGIRLSHRDVSEVGKHFIGDDLIPALHGRENVSVNHGVLAEALRVFTPVFDARHQQIGVVAIGISLSKVDKQISHSRWGLLLAMLFSALVGSLGIWVLVRVLKRILFGLEPYEISTLFEQRQAMLQSLKEGLLPLTARAISPWPTRRRVRCCSTPITTSPATFATRRSLPICKPCCKAGSRCPIRRLAATGIYCCVTACPCAARTGSLARSAHSGIRPKSVSYCNVSMGWSIMWTRYAPTPTNL
jgi:hypothetical protein